MSTNLFSLYWILPNILRPKWPFYPIKRFIIWWQRCKFFHSVCTW